MTHGTCPNLVSFRLKTAGPTKQEAARIDVENAEDDLVQKTEVAITLMKTVLENVSLPHVSRLVHGLNHSYTQPEPIKNLNELAKAQVRILDPIQMQLY